HGPLTASGLGQGRPELGRQERGLRAGVGLGRDGADLPPTQAETFFKKARTWVNPRRMPVCSSMAAWASRAERGGWSTKYSSRETRWGARALAGPCQGKRRTRSRPPAANASRVGWTVRR